jgi:hypothetical protein
MLFLQKKHPLVICVKETLPRSAMTYEVGGSVSICPTKTNSKGGKIQCMLLLRSLLQIVGSIRIVALGKETNIMN